MPLTLDEIKAMLTEHGIDLDALQAAAAQPPATLDQGTLSAALTQALSTTPVALSANGEHITGDDLVGAVVELSRQNKVLADHTGKMRRVLMAEPAVDAAIYEKKLLEHQRDYAIRVYLTSEDDFAELTDSPKPPDSDKKKSCRRLLDL